MRQEQEEQPERVTISADSVAAGSTHAFKIVMKKLWTNVKRSFCFCRLFIRTFPLFVTFR